jgi:hypothetical protein
MSSRFSPRSDPKGFQGAFGPPVAERRHPKFFINPAGCMWCGASWPFATSQTLTAMANVINNYRQEVVGKKEYFDMLKAYTRSHRHTLEDGKTVSWIDESLNPDTGRWIMTGSFPMSRGRYDLFIPVGSRDGMPQIALPLSGDDGHCRYRLGTVTLH